MKITIRPPKTSEEFDQYYHVRWEVLRKPLDMPPGSEKSLNEDKYFHLAAFIDGQMCGTGLLFPRSKKIVQIKQIAVLEKFRAQKIGSQIIAALENEAQRQGFEQITLEARKFSQAFYLKNGYKTIEGSDHLSLNIPHITMEKHLK